MKKLIMGDQADVAAEVGHADGAEKLRIATCAVMLEIANSDDEFTDQERNRIIEILKGKFGLAKEEALELMEVARERIDESIDIWGFTDTINRVYTVEEKIRVLEAVWEIIYADGELSGHEDTLVHKLSFLLGLKHKQLIEAKMKARGNI